MCRNKKIYSNEKEDLEEGQCMKEGNCAIKRPNDRKSNDVTYINVCV